MTMVIWQIQLTNTQLAHRSFAAAAAAAAAAVQLCNMLPASLCFIDNFAHFK